MTNSKKYFTTSIGNSIIDVLVFVDDEFLERNSLEKGSMTLVGQNRASVLTKLKYEKVCSGGSVANTTVTMAKFGIKNAFIGKIGNGNYGNLFEEDLTNNNVDFYCKNKTEFGSTARSFVLITPDKERTMCTFLGASANISDEVDLNVVQDSEILYLEGYLWDQEPVIAALKKAIMTARKNQVKIAFTLCDSFCVNNHRSDFLKIVNIADFVFANENEIKALTQSDIIDYEKIKEICQNNEKLTLIITRSEKTVIIFDAKTKEFTEISANKVENISDATGAGDAFAAGFLYGVNKKLSAQESAQTGHLFASNVIQNIGARLTQEQITNITNILQSKANVA